MEAVKQTKKMNHEINLTPPSKNDELLRTWIESKEAPTQEFIDKILEWVKVVFDKHFGNKQYVTDRQIEGLLIDVTLKLIKFRNKFNEDNGMKIYSYFHSVIISELVRN
tara:strand:+ start:1205 stop:1531 length:327 start_codon:yes stop_codon:yes gene_type:complete